MEVDKKILIALIEAAMSADYTRVRRTANMLSKQFLELKDSDTAKQIQTIVRKKGVPLQASGYAQALPLDAGSRLPLLEEGPAPSSPILLDEVPGKIVSQFLEDAANFNLLEEMGLTSRLGLLLYGKPGTGKSLLASHIAAKLERPFYVVRLDSLISSRLGETAKNIRGIFDFVPAAGAVLFLDEMDAIAKLRDDRQELGELKRVVNAVLQGIDSLSDDVVIIGATNHPQLLDQAIWRRFPYKIELELPGESVRQAMWQEFLLGGQEGRASDALVLAKLSDQLSGADIENIALSARRRAILDKTEINMPSVLLAISTSRTGSPTLPDARPLSSDDKRALALVLRDRAQITVSEIARVIGTSRQMAHRYLKNEVEGDDG
jgi:SpoVK/Ycf46/Vps4 family AAA+-type ATPase